MTDQKTTKRGQCGDCSQGILTPVHDGFALYSEGEDDTHAFWYCLYCGSNNITLLDEEHHPIIHQADLYRGRA